MTKKLAMQIGAGNIGRGLNGYLLNKNKFRITFLDLSPKLVFKLNAAKSYFIHQVDNPSRKKEINNYQALNINDEQLILANISKYSLFTISIGFNNLSKLELLFSKIIKKLVYLNSTKMINIVAIENGISASSHLKKIIFNNLTTSEKLFANKYIGFVDCAVDRIVPNNQDQTLDINVESFYELVLDEKSWKGTKLTNGKIIYASDINKYIEKKLYMLNAVHTFIAWNGIKKNFQYVHEFTNFKIIKNDVNELLEEFKTILVKKYSFSKQELDLYSNKIINRLSNQKIKDLVTRSGRDVIRKLSWNERFVKPLQFTIQYQLKNSLLIKAIALAFSDLNFNDKELKEFNQYINLNGVTKAINKYLKIKDKAVINKIKEAINH